MARRRRPPKIADNRPNSVYGSAVTRWSAGTSPSTQWHRSAVTSARPCTRVEVRETEPIMRISEGSCRLRILSVDPPLDGTIGPIKKGNPGSPKPGSPHRGCPPHGWFLTTSDARIVGRVWLLEQPQTRPAPLVDPLYKTSSKGNVKERYSIHSPRDHVRL